MGNLAIGLALGLVIGLSLGHQLALARLEARWHELQRSRGPLQNLLLGLFVLVGALSAAGLGLLFLLR